MRNSLFDLGPQAVPSLKQPGAFQCTQCSETFDTHQECTAHMFGKHRIKSSVRLAISDTICSCCLLDFHTRTKIHHHIAYKSAKCRLFYSTLPPLDPELYAKLEAEESKAVKVLKAAGRSILYHPIHTVRVPGPLIGP